MASLAIRLTKKCNLDCDFCYNYEDMHDESKASRDLDLALEAFLMEEGDKFDEFLISGGEPLIDMELLENTLSVLLSHSTEKIITIFTNGCYITPEFVENVNRFPNIFVNISFDGMSDDTRGLLNLLERNDLRLGYKTLESIQSIKRKYLTCVVTKDKLHSYTLPFEVFTLYKTFDSHVSLTLDGREEALNSFSIDDVYAFGEFIYRLDLLGCYGEKKVYFNKFFESECNRGCDTIFQWDGSVKSLCGYVSESGCQKWREQMKPGMYDLLKQFALFDQFKFDTKLEDKPQYDPTVGYMGQRWEFEPKRKHLQHAERIAIREVK